ncbi:MAG: hypothetical protein VB104_07245 [Candidatus Limiplasma sp.]|nr:hypothetical protein [Candidatus Limiplasma sp.]
MKKTVFLFATLLFVVLRIPAPPMGLPGVNASQSAKAFPSVATMQACTARRCPDITAANTPAPSKVVGQGFLFSEASAEGVTPTLCATPEPSPTATPCMDGTLSETAALTLAKALLQKTFGFTLAQANALHSNTTYWAGENVPVCYLIAFYRGAFTSANRVISIAFQVETGKLQGYELLLDGAWAWVEPDDLTGDILQRVCVPTPNPTRNSLIPIDSTPAPTPTLAPAATPDPDAVARMKTFVEQVFVPYVLADADSLTFTPAQRQELLTMAENAGLPFTPDWQNTILAGSEPRAKNDVLSDLVGSQLHYEGSWPVEDQYWYGEMRVRCGFWTDNPCLLPIPGELTQAEALAYAKQCLLDQTTVDEAWLQACDICWSFQRGTPDADGASDLFGDRIWWITFYPDDPLASNAYLVTFNAIGGNVRIIVQ